MDKKGNDEDIILIQRIMSGDTDSFRLLVERYGPAISRFCRSRLGSAEDAEDAAQDVFLRAFKSIAGFRLGKSFSSWLFMIAVNRVKTKYSARESARRTNLRVEAEFAAALGTDIGEDPERLAIETMETESIRAAIGKLAKERRDVVELYYIAGLSVAEVAETLKIGTEAVKSRLWRSRKELREWLSRATETKQRG